MPRLDSVAADELRTALEATDGARAATRLVAAIAHKHGVPQSDLAEWLGVERKTVYNWFRRLETGDSLVEAARDRDRSGRPRKLSDDQRAKVADLLQNPPTAAGYDEPRWTGEVLRRLLAERWGVEYAPSSCRRLLAELE